MSVIMALAVVLSSCNPPPPTIETHRHSGPKVNISDLIRHTAAYKGKTMTLNLKVDEPILAGKGKSLRDFAGKDVKFTAPASNGERLNLVIKIPENVAPPEAFQSDELRVTFTCTRGDLRQGNEARTIELP
jgi:hypothetical protein